LSTEQICRSASIVLGAVSPVPHRAKAAEVALVGRQIDETSARAAAAAAVVDASPLTRNGHKVPIVETLVRRAILTAARM